MKIAFFDTNKTLVEVTRLQSDRYTKFLEVVSTDVRELNESQIVFLDKEVLKNKIIELLEERKSLPSDIPEYEGRFNEDEIFEYKRFNNQELKLCNTGRDNTIIFLINLFNIQGDHVYLMFAENFKKIREYQQKFS